MALLTIASLTLREVVRRRLLAAVAGLTLLLVGFTAWGLWKIADAAQAQNRPDVPAVGTYALVVLLLAYLFGVMLSVGAAFLAAPAIAGDVESGIALALLPRPIRRADFVLGKWLGLAALLVAYAAVAGTLELGVVRAVTGYVPPHPVDALAFLAAEGLASLSLATLLSTRLAPITSGIVAVVCFGIAWIAGIAQSIGFVLHNQSLIHATTALGLVLPTDGLWRAAAFNLDPTALAVAAMTDVARQSPFIVGAPPPPAFLWWTLGWLVAVLAAAVVSFARRDV
jgi:ABC-type transport system involved in multi-copper enzyme maturation permease subunit